MSLQHAVMTLSVTESLFSRNFVPYSITACGALLTYDILCTFDKEVEYVWSGPWSFGTILYVLNRYLPFIDTFISVKMLSGYNSPEECLVGNTVLTWFIVLGTIISEVILMFRTYAIWGRKRSILGGLAALFVIVFVPAVIVTHLEITTLVYVPSQFAGQSGCFLDHAGAIIFVAYILLILCETSIVVLTGIKAVQHLRHTRSSWIRKMYQDGFVFYIYLLLTSVVNITIPLTAPPAYANMFATPQRIFHSVFSARVLLLLFQQRKREVEPIPLSVLTSVFSGDTLDVN